MVLHWCPKGFVLTGAAALNNSGTAKAFRVVSPKGTDPPGDFLAHSLQ